MNDEREPGGPPAAQPSPAPASTYAIPGGNPPRRRRLRCHLLIALLALPCAAAISLVWLWIERDPGDTIDPGFRYVTVDLTRSVPLAPDSIGLKNLIKGFEVSNATRLTVQPCPQPDAKPGGCTLDAPRNDKLQYTETSGFIVTVWHPAEGSVTFHPSVMLDHDSKPCSMTFVPKNGSLQLQAGEKQSCGRIATTLTPSLQTNDKRGGLKIVQRLRSGALIHTPLPLACPDQQPGQQPCRITIEAEDTATFAHSPLRVVYTLKAAEPAVLLDNDQGSLAGAIASIRGTLTGRGTQAWFCRSAPGDVLALNKPALSRLILGGERNSTELTATVRGYGSTSCRPAAGKYLFRFVTTAITLISILELLMKLCRCGAGAKEKTP